MVTVGLIAFEPLRKWLGFEDLPGWAMVVRDIFQGSLSAQVKWSWILDVGARLVGGKGDWP